MVWGADAEVERGAGVGGAIEGVWFLENDLSLGSGYKGAEEKVG